jgi:heme exporter protein B
VSALGVALAVARKDLLTEWRVRDRVIAMGVFSMLVVITFHFALPAGTGEQIEANSAGLLWVAFVFAALLGLNRSFAQELENDAFAGLALAPVDRGAIFLGKAAANFVLTGVVQVLTAVVFAVVFGLDWLGFAPSLAAIVALGSFGICSIGTLFSAMAVRTRYREVLLPILLLPALFPVLAGAVRGTSEVLSGGGLPFEAVQLLLVIDGIYATVSYLVFEYVLDE